MDRAWIDGKEVSRKAAISEAARLLAASRVPLIAGLGTDIAGARAAIALASRIGAAIDHMHADALLRRLDVMRSADLMTTTPAEARLRADCLLLVGSGIGQQLRALLDTDTSKRHITWLCPDRAARDIAKGAPIDILGRNPAELPIVLAMLRARIAGRADRQGSGRRQGHRQQRGTAQGGAVRGRDLVRGAARRARNRDVAGHRRRPQRDDAFHQPAD